MNEDDLYQENINNAIINSHPALENSTYQGIVGLATVSTQDESKYRKINFFCVK